MFEEAGARLPAPALLVMRVGEGFRAWGWWALPLGVAAVVALVRLRLRNPSARLRFDRWVLRLPLVGELVARIETARLARTMATLLANGVEALSALAIVRNTVSNAAIRQGLADAAAGLRKGDGLTLPLRESRVLPPLAIQLIAVGEESGQLAPMLGKVAEVFEREASATIARLLSLLTPVLTLLMGAVVASVIGAILSAILSVYSLPL
jgi:general secretion pathway protein F